jgi:hypothetical protein
VACLTWPAGFADGDVLKNNEEVVQVNEGEAWSKDRRQDSLCWATATG